MKYNENTRRAIAALRAPLKSCSICNEAKPLSRFNKDRNEPDGLEAHCRRCNKRHYKERRMAGKEYRARMLWRKYGMSLSEYDTKLQAQKGVCAICGEEERAKSKKGNTKHLCVDHNHTTGAVRGLLCGACNTALGTIEKQGWVAAALGYLAAYDGNDMAFQRQLAQIQADPNLAQQVINELWRRYMTGRLCLPHDLREKIGRLAWIEDRT